MLIRGSYNVSSAEEGDVRRSNKTLDYSQHWVRPLISFLLVSGVVLAVCLLTRHLTPGKSSSLFGGHNEALQNQNIVKNEEESSDGSSMTSKPQYIESKEIGIFANRTTRANITFKFTRIQTTDLETSQAAEISIEPSTTESNTDKLGKLRSTVAQAISTDTTTKPLTTSSYWDLTEKSQGASTQTPSADTITEFSTTSPYVDPTGNTQGAAMQTPSAVTTTESPATSPLVDPTAEPPSLCSKHNRSNSAYDGPDLNFDSQVANLRHSYMNHSANACTHFYEYACGKFEADRTILENDLAPQATKRIFDQANSIRSSANPSKFLRYYDSCMNYESKFNESERLKLALSAIKEIGTFYTEEEFEENRDFDLTNLLSKLFLHNSAPLFDIIPKLAMTYPSGNCDEHMLNAPTFILSLTPPVLKNSFYVNKPDKCYNDQKSAMREEEVDFEELYKNYKECKNGAKDLLESMGTAINAFPSFREHHASIESGVKLILKEISEVDRSLRTKYILDSFEKPTDIETFKEKMKLPSLNFTKLLQELGVKEDRFIQELHIRNLVKFVKRFKKLKSMNKRVLNNALLGFYVHKIYYELVVPGRNKDYCKRIAISLMEKHASSLYMSSFSTEQIRNMRQLTTNVFKELKTTLESGVKNASWLRNFDVTVVLEKIQNLSIAVPDISYYQNDTPSSLKNTEIEEELSGNFFNDTIMLQRNYRKSMYRMLGKSPNGDEEIWTYLALPHQSAGSVIHGMNKIIMPYGAVDWPVIRYADGTSSASLVLATLGTRIAYEIGHHFDATGSRYTFNEVLIKGENLFGCCKSSTEDNRRKNYQDYIDQHSSPESKTKKEKITLPSTKQKIQYQISDVNSNQRISDTIGLQLAYDTMIRLSSNPSESILPCVTGIDTDDEKGFFLAYAQTHCTKKPLTSSFVSMYEDEHLPSRLRISVVATKNEKLKNIWNCARDSDVSSIKIHGAFPNLELVNSTVPIGRAQ